MVPWSNGVLYKSLALKTREKIALHACVLLNECQIPTLYKVGAPTKLGWFLTVSPTFDTYYIAQWILSKDYLRKDKDVNCYWRMILQGN